MRSLNGRRMYWILGDEDGPEFAGIWSGAMDGTSGTLIIPRERDVLDMTIDTTSKLLFWLEMVLFELHWEIYNSDFDGNNMKLTIKLRNEPHAFQVWGNHLFWTTVGQESVISCEKTTANNLMTHGLSQLNLEKPNFLIVSPMTGVEERQHPCTAGGLCSHICIPTAVGYMRCICPVGYRLLPDGWTCGER